MIVKFNSVMTISDEQFNSALNAAFKRAKEGRMFMITEQWSTSGPLVLHKHSSHLAPSGYYIPVNEDNCCSECKEKAPDFVLLAAKVS
jgi:hypothetical protein